MKVGLLTLYGNSNFGNRLQNYAVQQIVNNYADSVDTIIWDEVPIKTKISLRIKKRFGIEYLDAFDKKKREIFDLFNEGYIHTRKVKKRFNSISRRIDKQYDFFIVGSDQVWNPEIRKTDKEIYFLRFCKRSKRIPFSPSIGITSIPNEDREWFKDYVSDFPVLSCREDVGCRLIADITGKECEHLIDPTLVLDRQTWLEFSAPIEIPQKYVLLCMLGNTSKEVHDEIYNYSKTNDMEIIDIFDKRSHYFSISPQNFVYLIANSSLVITDSYHACAFSINMKVPFVALDRCDELNSADNHTLSRIFSILQLFHLEDNFVSQNSFKLDEPKVDDQIIDAVLEVERIRVKKYLEKCFGIK